MKKMSFWKKFQLKSIRLNLLIPVLILGMAGAIGCFSGIYNLGNIQKASKEISGERLDSVIYLDEINNKFNNLQKNDACILC